MGKVTTRVVSSFGRVCTTFYTLLKYINEECGENLEVCDVGCLDGLHTIPFAKRTGHVYGFDMNMIYLYGGHVEYPIIKNENEVITQRRTILGAEDRINIENIHDKIDLYSVNFFKSNQRQYDVVYSKRVLSRDEYADISMEKKIEALKKAVKTGGMMYLEYLMWTDDSNTEQLNRNQYLKQCEMETYFKDGWDILSIVEDRNCINEEPHIGNPTFHKHRVGMIKVRKNPDAFPEYFDINMNFE